MVGAAGGGRRGNGGGMQAPKEDVAKSLTGIKICSMGEKKAGSCVWIWPFVRLLLPTGLECDGNVRRIVGDMQGIDPAMTAT